MSKSTLLSELPLSNLTFSHLNANSNPNPNPNSNSNSNPFHSMLLRLIFSLDAEVYDEHSYLKQQQAYNFSQTEVALTVIRREAPLSNSRRYSQA